MSCPLLSFFEYVPAAPANFLDGDSAAKSLVPFPNLPGVTFKQGLLAGITTDGTAGEATLQVTAAAWGKREGQ